MQSRPASADQRLPRHALRDLPLSAGGRVRGPQGASLCCGRGSNRPASALPTDLARGVHDRGARGEGPRRRGARAGREVRRAARDDRDHPRDPQRVPSRSTTSSPQRIPDDADPQRDVVFIVRAGALFPVYRTSSLLEQLKGKVHVPAVLFYPGELDGAAGLRFMGVLDAEHNYRPKIF